MFEEKEDVFDETEMRYYYVGECEHCGHSFAINTPSNDIPAFCPFCAETLEYRGELNSNEDEEPA